jgi:hypothetical protein
MEKRVGSPLSYVLSSRLGVDGAGAKDVAR